MEAKEDANDISDRIPVEVIAEILSYLPPVALKQARLVCKKWSDASKSIICVENLKFLFRGRIYPSKEELIEMFDTLEGGCFRYLNLNFIRTKLKDVFKTFASSHGAQIRSLSFRDCLISFDTIKTIILNCENLKRLEFVNCYTDDDSEFSIANGSKVVRNSLKKLKIWYCDWLSLDFLSIILDVYPSIEKLELLKHGDSPCDLFYTAREKCPKIKELSMDLTWMYRLENENAIRDIKSPRLKHLRIPSFPSYDVTKKFITTYTNNLTSLHLEGCNHVKVELFELILQHIINLENLKVHVTQLDSRGSSTQLKNILKLLAESRLKTLDCRMFVEFDHQPEEFICDIPLNYTLERLTVYTRFIYTNYFCGHMLKIFQNISHLHLSSSYSRNLVSYIFGNMVNLRSLTMRFQMLNYHVDDSIFSNCKLFPYLEDFTLTNCRGLTERVIKQFRNFPQLKSLKLIRCDTIKECGIVQIPTILPLLEYLDISHAIISNDTLLQICQQLKYLRILGTKDISSIVGDSLIKELIVRCPSLRVAKFGYNKVYYYNHLRKKMMRIERYPELIFFATEVL